jgi:hypothetical protein
MVSKLKRPSIEWEKIFASYTSDKGQINRIYLFQKEKSKWQNKQTNKQKPHEKMLTISTHKGNAN